MASNMPRLHLPVFLKLRSVRSVVWILVANSVKPIPLDSRYISIRLTALILSIVDRIRDGFLALGFPVGNLPSCALALALLSSPASCICNASVASQEQTSSDASKGFSTLPPSLFDPLVKISESRLSRM
jgi:hypothetical protein